MSWCREITIAVCVALFGAGLVIFKLDDFIAAYNKYTGITTKKQEPTVKQQPDEKHPDCRELQKGGQTPSGVYTVYIGGHTKSQVFCDMETDGGGWTVFQRRLDGEIDFYRGWEDYRLGFGDPHGEFWLGNQLLHLLTALDKHELRVDLEDFDNQTRFAIYGVFAVSGPDTDYKLSVSNYMGDAGDSLGYHNGCAFSTHDGHDHDHTSGNCAEICQGAWWYNNCQHANLNGEYLKGETPHYHRGVRWDGWRDHYSLKRSKMMTRKIN